jgi:hypothetical protein
MIHAMVRCLTVAAALAPAAAPAQPITLTEVYTPGYQYHVSCRTEIAGQLTVPAESAKGEPKNLAISGSGVIDYDERVAAVAADGAVQKTCRIYRTIDFQRKVGNEPQASTLRPAVRRLVLLRHQQKEVPFSPDGPLTWAEIDLVRTDVFTPALVGLLPAGPVGVGDEWNARPAAVAELTDLEAIDQGQLRCRFEEVATVAGRPHARIGLSGALRGTSEDGPSRQQLDGYFYFDLQSRHLSYLYLRGVHSLLDKNGQEMGRIDGRFVLTRQAHTQSADLADTAWRGLDTEPNEANTRLLYDNAELGIQLQYPRRWRVGQVRGRQLTLDDPAGSGLLITLEPTSRLPSAAQFLLESTDYLRQQKLTIGRTEPPRRLQGPPQEIDHFVLEVQDAGSAGTRLAYYVLRQAGGGATIAARIPANDPGRGDEVDRIVRSVTLDMRR